MSNPRGQTKGPVFRWQGEINEAAMNALTATALDNDYILRSDLPLEIAANIVWIFTAGVWSPEIKGLIDAFVKKVLKIQDAEAEFLITTDVSKAWSAKVGIFQILNDDRNIYSSYVTAIPVDKVTSIGKTIRLVAF